jgi:hypothetical protein
MSQNEEDVPKTPVIDSEIETMHETFNEHAMILKKVAELREWCEQSERNYFLKCVALKLEEESMKIEIKELKENVQFLYKECSLARQAANEANQMMFQFKAILWQIQHLCHPENLENSE